jgi:cellulose synthase (UDP-forming)
MTSRATSVTTAAPPTTTDDAAARRQGPIRALALLATVVGVAYLLWRAVFTINPDALVLSWLLWTLEAHAVLGLGIFTFALWDVPPSVPPTTELPDGRVAVLITSYDEPVEIVLPVLRGAIAMHGEHETWLLDDGDRPEMRRLAEELGARYLARPDNRHAKAGNLNHALSVVDADLVAVLDADHVPHPEFLRRTLPSLVDERIALVQTPQDFYNEDSFEHATSARQARRGRSYTEQSLFYRVIQPAKNRWQSAFWCGTGAVLRVAALREVGGVATGSITEDLQTTIRLHRAGWRSRYHDEVLARGLAAPTAEEYQLQRRRWCMGAIQTLKQERPLRDPDLSIEQRLSYGVTILAWFDSLRVLGLLLLPPLVLFTGQAPIAAPLLTFVVWFTTYIVLQQVAMMALGRGRMRPVASTVFDLVRLQATLVALVSALTDRKVPFSVTPKGRTSGTVRRIRVPRLLLGLAAVYIAAFSWYLATVGGYTARPYASPGVAHGAAFWLVVGGVMLWLAVTRVRAMDFAPERRASHRTEVHAPARVGDRDATLLDVSATGARLHLHADDVHERTGELVQLTLAGAAGAQDLSGEVTKVDRHPEGPHAVRVGFQDGQLTQRAEVTTGLHHPDQLAAVEAAARPPRRGDAVRDVGAPAVS